MTNYCGTFQKFRVRGLSQPKIECLKNRITKQTIIIAPICASTICSNLHWRLPQTLDANCCFHQGINMCYSYIASFFRLLLGQHFCLALIPFFYSWNTILLSHAVVFSSFPFFSSKDFFFFYDFLMISLVFLIRTDSNNSTDWNTLNKQFEMKRFWDCTNNNNSPKRMIQAIAKVWLTPYSLIRKVLTKGCNMWFKCWLERTTNG